MPRLASSRVVKQIQRETERLAYGDAAIYYATPDPENDLDSYGQPPQDSTGITVACSFNDKPSKEKWGASMDIQNIAGEIRFDALKPDKGGRFQIIERWDESDADPHIFDIVDIRRRGVFGWDCLLATVKI
ncbi:MAG: hypothetical protein JRE23_16510 [Deltaproteobacteria bacterium]|nr:hypothetical protein [Deltaproteobacteria bacterium]